MPMNTQQKQNTENGFILLYVVIAVTIFVALASSVVSGTVTQVELGAQELSAVRSTMAADMALECASYYATHPERPFYTNTPAVNIICGPGMNFNSYNGAANVNQLCVADSAFVSPDLTLSDGSGGVSCARIGITTRPRTIRVQTGGSTFGPYYYFCAHEIRADGYDGACGSENVRTKWERVGGYDATLFPDPTTVDARVAGVMPAQDVGTPDLNIPTAKRVSLTTSSSSVFQIERSTLSGFKSKTNPIKFTLSNLGASVNPIGPVIGIRVQTSTALDTALIPTSAVADIEISTPAGAPVTEGLYAGDSFNLTVGVPADLATGVYLLRVTARYLSATSSVIVPLEVYSSTRGQY
jgi:type II secretory pathway pseudopilin PulG